ncbi:MAG: peptidylprolyl isomerase [Kiloniellaceae bacterium]
MAAREHNRIGGFNRAFSGLLALGLALLPAAGTAQSVSPDSQVPGPVPENTVSEALPLPEAPAAPAVAGPEVARLKEAFEQMNAENPVVARVNGHEIRWSEVVASADDLPERYREQIESVFPALLDRLVDLRLLADAARAEGLGEDAAVRRRVAAYEDRVLSGTLLERYLAENVTTAALRQRYDALVAARRGDREIRARHILLDSREAAEAAIARLDAGEIFISLATELSQGTSSDRGGDLGYFHPRRMAPAFAEAVLALEPGQYSGAPVRTEFGWHVILLVDRRADDIPSFLDMQDKLREEATKLAVDRLLIALRQQAALEMFPEDAGAAVGPEAGQAGEAPAKE